MAANQDNLNLFLCLHLNTSSLHSLSSSLQSLKLIIIFSSIHKLHQLLKIFTIDDCLTIFHFIWGVSPDPKVPKIVRVVWFLCHELKLTVFVFSSQWRYLYKPSPHHYIPWGKCRLSIRCSSSSIICPRCISLSSTVTGHLIWSPIIPI